MRLFQFFCLFFLREEGVWKAHDVCIGSSLLSCCVRIGFIPIRPLAETTGVSHCKDSGLLSAAC